MVTKSTAPATVTELDRHLLEALASYARWDFQDLMDVVIKRYPDHGQTPGLVNGRRPHVHATGYGGTGGLTRQATKYEIVGETETPDSLTWSETVDQWYDFCNYVKEDYRRMFVVAIYDDCVGTAKNILERTVANSNVPRHQVTMGGIPKEYRSNRPGGLIGLPAPKLQILTI